MHIARLIGSLAAGAQIPDGVCADLVNGAGGRSRGRAADDPRGAAEAGITAPPERAAYVAAGSAWPHTCALLPAHIACCLTLKVFTSRTVSSMSQVMSQIVQRYLTLTLMLSQSFVSL